MTIQFDKFGWYYDAGDPGTFASTTQSLAPLPTGTTKPMMRNVILADVISINGRPARGGYVSHGVAHRLTNTDLQRNNVHYFALDIQTPALQQIGNLFGIFLSSGNAAPGAAPGAGNWAVLGGSGAYIGVQGQGSNVGGANYHLTLMQEDSAARRANSSGQIRLDFFLSGIAAPEIVLARHAVDGSLVSSASPARAGETLILEVKAGWPVRPPLEPGKVFAGEPFQLVAIPVEATVNDQPAEVYNAIGWPGARDRYRIDVTLPAVDPPEATLVLTAGYILSTTPYKVPLR
jgi:hypothetical protein